MMDDIDLAGYNGTDLAQEDLTEEPWFSVAVAGLQFYAYNSVDDLIGRVRPTAGDRLHLVRRPDNEAHGNAIKVWWQNRFMLGHLPRDVANAIAPLIDTGKGARAYVADAGDGSTWSLIALIVGPAAAGKNGERIERLVWEESAKIWRQTGAPTERQNRADAAFWERRWWACAQREADAITAFLPLVEEENRALPALPEGADQPVD